MQDTDTSLLLYGANIATLEPDREDFGLMHGGSILVQGSRISWVGARGEQPPVAADTERDMQGRLVTPGLIDCHTHLVFAGDRSDEFEARLEGATYAEIAEAGGGILSTVGATRAATEDALTEIGLSRVLRLAAEGVTTVEVKSGYGLDLETECRMLRAARQIDESAHVDIVTSYLGAHMVPPEFKESRDDYIDYICDEVLPAVAERELADAVDGFCEEIAFSADEMEQVFEAAGDFDLPVKLHAEQLSNQGGAELAAGFGALSADHLEFLSVAGVEAMAESGSVAVLLPGAYYYLRETKTPPVSALRDHGVPMAVATDLNPGSSPVFSLLSAMTMACIQFGLTVEEAFAGVTRNAANALGLTDRGMIMPGYLADLAIWDVGRPAQLVYPLGLNPCSGVIKSGRIIALPEPVMAE